MVTRKTEDGSFELVYENVDELSDAPEDSPPTSHRPAWKKRALLWGSFVVAVLVLLVGGVFAAMTFLDNEDAPRKVTSNQKAKRAGSDKTYEYVPPSKNLGRLDLAAQPEQDEAVPAPTPKSRITKGSPGINPAGGQPPPEGDSVLSGPPKGRPPSGLNGAPPVMPGIGERLNPSSIKGGGLPTLSPRLGGALGDRRKFANPSLAGGPSGAEDDGSGANPDGEDGAGAPPDEDDTDGDEPAEEEADDELEEDVDDEEEQEDDELEAEDEGLDN